MKGLLAITDLTRMQGHRVCVAGYLPDDTCVRPVLWGSHLIERWLWRNGQVVVRPFAVVELDLKEKTPNRPHTEDWIIDAVHRENCGMLTQGQQKELLRRIEDPSVAAIFGAQVHVDQGWFVKDGEGSRSLGTVRPKEIGAVQYALKDAGRWDYRIAFADQTGVRYRLAVTDLAFRNYLDHMRLRQGLAPEEAARRLTATLRKVEVFLRIGLARGWEKFPDRCFLQITGVHTFPDYLDGRCFADFDLPPAEARIR